MAARHPASPGQRPGLLPAGRDIAQMRTGHGLQLPQGIFWLHEWRIIVHVDVIVVSIIGSAALFAVLMWWTRVTGQRRQALLQGRKFETGRYAAAQGWQVWENPGGDTGDRPWSGLLAQWSRGPGRGWWVTMAVEGSRSGHGVCGLWTTHTGGEGDPYFYTTCGLLLPHAYQTELSVQRRYLRPLIRSAPHRGGRQDPLPMRRGAAYRLEHLGV